MAAAKRTGTGRKAVLPELAALPQWVLWTGNKLPIDPKTGNLAKSDDPRTWGTFAEVKAAFQQETSKYRGFMLALRVGGPYTVIDLDHCRNAETGEIEPWAQTIIDSFASYAEVSPSKTGVHIWIRARMPGGKGRKHGAIEAYCELRFMTITGEHVEGTPREIAERQDELSTFVAATFPVRAEAPKHTTSGQPGGERLSEAEVIARAMRAKDGADFAALWGGTWQGRYSSQSEADLALCGKLAFWTGGDATAIDALFRQSGLYREKWDEQHGTETYGERTITAVLSSPRDAYTRCEKSEISPMPQEDSSLNSLISQPLYPQPPREKAFYGLAGEIARTISPYTEADPVALLVQLLVSFGSACGRGPYFRAEADRHYANLFAVLVGNTAKGRKGSSWGQIRQRMEAADATWAAQHIISGLSSGEGVIHALRDVPESELDSEREPLLADKRLLVHQGEFASVLKMLTRDGNILSDVLREAWDGQTLRVLTKQSPERASQTHLSIIGHITRDELVRHLSATEAGNGFGNRFLWVCVKRWQLLPDGSEIPEETFAALDERLAKTLMVAQSKRLVTRDPEARALWHDEYERLSEGKPGLLGAMTARAEAQVMRLAMLYALLDTSFIIKRCHLEAALAVWDYAEASARYIFGDALGDPVADSILRALRQAPAGMTRSDISALFGRHKEAAKELVPALNTLIAADLARYEMRQTDGRPAERWYAVRATCAKSARSEEGDVT